MPPRVRILGAFQIHCKQAITTTACRTATEPRKPETCPNLVRKRSTESLDFQIAVMTLTCTLITRKGALHRVLNPEGAFATTLCKQVEPGTSQTERKERSFGTDNLYKKLYFDDQASSIENADADRRID